MTLAFVFPGQGSQYVGMGRDLYEQYEEARAVFDQADQVLGFSLTDMCFNGSGEDLSQTINTQPAVLTVSVACLAVWNKLGGPKPTAVAGHSLGEYSALVAAGSLAFADAVSLVRNRGRYMQEAVPVGEGGMAALMGLSGEAAQELCQKAAASGVVEAVNLNSPGQVVIAGDNNGLQAAAVLAKEAKAKYIPLSVSAPFHSSMMRPAGARLGADLESINLADPTIPVIANVTADYANSGAEIKELLIKQVYSPVRWEETVVRLIESGVDTVVEIGPGKVLSGLVKKINRKIKITNIEVPASYEKALALVGEVS
ncbi:MAG: ACP S-malonyltransferase [Peptococcaceae bacterium]|nr:ACP S-malonyltransferase [Peptococcaceae bacterium]